MFEQLVRKVKNHTALFRVDSRDERPFKAQFVGEQSYDAGGPFRDALENICTEITEKMLKPTANMETHPDMMGYQPQLLNTMKDYKHFLIFGKMIGWAIMSQRDSLSLCMNHIFWKHLLNIPLDIDDLYQIDSTRHDFLKYQMVPGVFPETFVADLGSGEDVELCDGGSEREVTEQNRDEYVRLFI